MNAAKTNAERQAAFRARKAAQTSTEVRGLFAHPDDHQAVKDYAAKLAADRLEQMLADRKQALQCRDECLAPNQRLSQNSPTGPASNLSVFGIRNEIALDSCAQ